MNVASTITGFLTRLRTGLLWAAVLPALGGCGNQIPFDGWVKRYNANVERANNDLLLMNFVRAGEHMPLMFTGVQVVRGSGQVTNGLSATNTTGNSATSQFGTQPVFAWTNAFMPGFSSSVSDGFNFDVAILNSAEFYKGLLTPVTPDTFDFYLGQGIPPELLLNLLVERITIVENGVTRNYINDPGTPRYEAFRTTLDNMLHLGLTTEPTVTNLPVGPTLSPTDAKDVKSLVAAVQVGLLPMPAPGGYNLIKVTKAARFCFMAAQPGLPVLPQASLCKNSPAHRGPATAATAQAEGDGALIFEKASMTIQLRSTRSVFAYLGRLLIEQTERNLPIVELKTPEVQEIAPPGTGTAMLRVIKGGASSDSIAIADYRGTTYSIPLAEQGVSATVISIVTQLLSLNKSVNSVPSTGTVVVAH